MARQRPETVTITYDLFDLPTAQHKAGLAGMLLQIEHMSDRVPKLPTPRVVTSSTTSATIEFKADTVQNLMDNLYDAQAVVVRVKQKWASAKEVKPSEEVEEEIQQKGKDGKIVVKKVKTRYFFHEQTQPTGHFLKQHLPAMDPQKDWHKLWRDMLWAIPRGNPQSREDFERRAAGKPCKEGASAWEDLVNVEFKHRTNSFHTAAVAGSLWLGAQASNAENISFEGRAEQTLLLHFWPLVTQVFVPAILKVERKEGRVDVKSEFVGYVLAIPEVSDLPQFQNDYKVMLGGLELAIRGFRPAQAVIDLPAESALSFLSHLGTQKAAGAEVRQSVGSIEYLHQVKLGNNIKTQSAGRVSYRKGLVSDYERIVDTYANPLFRRGLMQALLEDQPWFQPFGNLFADWDVSFFVPTDAPPTLSWFWADARKKLLEVQRNMPTEPTDTPPDEDDVLATTISRFVQRYLDERIKKDKPEWDFAKFRREKRTPADAAEVRRKLAERLFLELRSRREQAFVDHFTNTFFSVGQYFGHRQMFERIANALMNSMEKVKTLTLMGLSANSYVHAPKKETAQ